MSGEIHQVHKEYAQTKIVRASGTNQLALPWYMSLTLPCKADYKLNRGLKLARHAAGRF